MADINVELTLIGTDDVNRLTEALNAFNGAVGGVTGKPRMSGNLATSKDSQESRSVQDANRKKYATADAASWANAHLAAGANVGRTGGLFSWMGGKAKEGYREIPGNGPIGKGMIALAFGPQMMHSLANVGGAVSGAIYGGGLTASGVQLGQSRTGSIFGIPTGGLMSPAFNTGFLNNVVYPLANITNPGASEGQSIAQQYGYNVSQGQSLWNMIGIGKGSGMGAGQRVGGLAANAISSGVSGDSTAQWIESLRYGGSNVGMLSDQLHQLGAAANAAHMSVATFSQQLTQTAQAYSQATGTSYGFAQNQSMALSTATGMTPGALQGTLTSTPLQAMSVAMAGGDMAKAFMGRNAGLNNMKAMEQMVAPYLGYPNFAAVAQAMKDPRKQHDIENKLFWLYQSPQGKELLGGMSPTEFIAMIKRTGGMGGITAGFHAAQSLMTAPHTNYQARIIGSELSQAGYTKAMGIANNPHLTAREKFKELTALQSNRMRDKTDNNNQITLTGYAAKIFKFAAQQYDKSHSSIATDTAQTAMNVGRSAPPR